MEAIANSSASKLKATGAKTTYQRRRDVPPPRPQSIKDKRATSNKRAIKHSAFMITINTNMSIDNDDEADRWGEKMEAVVDGLGYHGASCHEWGPFFKVNVGRGKKWLDKKGTKPNPSHDPNYNQYYANDDKQGVEHWCSFFERMHIEGGGVEWAPGTKKNHRNQYLHAHIFIKISHRTRLLVDRDYVASYFWDKMGLPHKPYVHVDVVKDNTQRVIDYVTKNAWNRNVPELQEKAREFFKTEA